jgi:hypothetical protein
MVMLVNTEQLNSKQPEWSQPTSTFVSAYMDWRKQRKAQSSCLYFGRDFKHLQKQQTLLERWLAEISFHGTEWVEGHVARIRKMQCKIFME